MIAARLCVSSTLGLATRLAAAVAVLVSLQACATYEVPTGSTPKQFSLTSPAPKANALKITFLGNSTIAFDDGSQVVLIDGFLTRPGLLKTAFGCIASDPQRVRQLLKKAGINRVDAVIVGHSHYDHLLDAPTVAKMSGAKLVGSQSTINVGREILPDDQLIVASPETPLQFGNFRVSLIPSEHGDYGNGFLDGMAFGEIPPGFSTPTRFFNYKDGGVFTIHITHPRLRTLAQTSAGFVEGALSNYSASVVFLCLALMDKMTETERESYWQEVVESVADGHVIVVPTHWDNFFRDLSQPLEPLPNVISDMETIVEFLERKTLNAPDRKLLWMGAFDTLVL